MDKSRHRGFTLVELMVTVALVGIIAGLPVGAATGTTETWPRAFWSLPMRWPSVRR
jgi:prepilin-type N-terminal cleavage/methylation domain-containing protein